VRPIITIDGNHETNEMFLENVRVPVANRVGEENKGWDYAKYLLGHERSGIARVGISKMRLQRARVLAQRIPKGSSTLAQDPHFLERAATLEIELKALEITQMRVIADSSRGAAGYPDPKTSILKIKGSELQQAATDLLLGLAAYEALEYDGEFLRGLREGDDLIDWARTLAPNHYFARHVSIVGGSNEIQHNILAKSILGL
jgi:alkylation response protein AidB-like acyl-CoA dehydrogenase